MYLVVLIFMLPYSVSYRWINRWWGLVEKSWGTVQSYPKELPFYSNFDQGHGSHIYHDGVQVSGTPWNNISSQSFQPFMEYFDESTTQLIKVATNFKDASYNGGGNITFTGTLDDDAEFTARLFKTQLLLGNTPVRFTFSVKSRENSLLGLVLVSSSRTIEEKSILLAAPGNSLLTMNRFSARFASVIMPSRVTNLGESGWVVQDSIIDMPGHTIREIRVLCYRSNKIPPGISSEYYAALGDIQITADGDNSTFPPSNSWLVESQFASWTSGPQDSKKLSVELSWKLDNGSADDFSKCNIYVDKTKNSPGNEKQTLAEGTEYVGMAVGNAFYVSDLDVPSDTTSLKFTIQPCGSDGTVQQLEESPFLIIPVEG